MNAIAIAKRYFELSNDSDFDSISPLLNDLATYDSQNTGLHTGLDDIVSMQKDFHKKFSSLGWTINDIKESQPNIVIIDYDFVGKKLNGATVNSSGLETIVVKNGRIIRIEVRNK